MRQGKYHEFDFKCHSFKSFAHLIRINQLFRELKSETRAYGRADIEDPNYATGTGHKSQGDQLANEIDEIANDFINQLNGGEDLPKPQAHRRSTYTKGLGRRTTTVLQKKLSKIDEAKETPIGGDDAHD